MLTGAATNHVTGGPGPFRGRAPSVLAFFSSSRACGQCEPRSGSRGCGQPPARPPRVLRRRRARWSAGAALSTGNSLTEERLVTHRLDVVAVGIVHERPVVVLGI